ncbi:MAG: pyruvate kinase [Dehalococcoidales bacterium]|nr:pyruvate kinase [Dehalococcoidales bacterium]
MLRNIHREQRTKIVCTLGPGVNSAAMIERLVRAGMNIARLNRSHGSFEEHARYIRLVREVAERVDSSVAVLMDLPGPKYRTGPTSEKSLLLKKGAEIILTSRPIEGEGNVIPLNFPLLYRDVRQGSTVLVDDGKIQLKVTSIRGGDVVCKVIAGGVLTPGRGVVVPGVLGSEPFLNDNLRENLDFAIQQKPDFIALSFVTCPDDIKQVRQILDQRNSPIPLVSKIERGEAVRNFDGILAVSNGIMVARGDLGVEVSLKEVPLIQKDIIRKCNKAGKAVITATQMLESMTDSPTPTRAEVADVANAILDGTDAIMLSSETSIGKYPIEAVRMMYEIAREIEGHLPYERILSQRAEWLEHQTDELISYNACHTAYQLKAAAIVAFTHSGSTARRVSKYRPHVPVLAITPSREIARRLVIYWGVQPFHIPEPATVEEFFTVAAGLARDTGAAHPGELVVVTGGIPTGKSGTTNLLKVQQVPG